MRDVSAPSFYAQCARSSTSRSGAIGVTRIGASCPWAPSRRSQSSVARIVSRSEEHTSELQSHHDLVCRLLLEKKKKKKIRKQLNQERNVRRQCEEQKRCCVA